MKYFYEKPNSWTRDGWKIVRCEHALFTRATLFLDENGKGFLSVQKHFDPVSRSMWWGSLEPWLACDIRKADGFSEAFERFANEDCSLVMPVRKLMWELRMKPLPKEFWEEEKF